MPFIYHVLSHLLARSTVDRRIYTRLFYNISIPELILLQIAAHVTFWCFGYVFLKSKHKIP